MFCFVLFWVCLLLHFFSRYLMVNILALTFRPRPLLAASSVIPQQYSVFHSVDYIEKQVPSSIRGLDI